MKTLLNLLNRTANAAKISGGGNSHHLIFKTLTLTLLLLTLGVGDVWGNVKHPVYCAISPSSLGDGTLKLKVTKGDTYDGGVEYITEMTKIPTTIHKSETGETKDLYYAIIEYVEDGLKYMSFEIYDGDSWREKHEAFNTWWTSPGYTKPIFDYENGNFTTYPANLAEKTSYVYFNAAEWTDAHDYIQLASGHGLYQGYNQLFKLSNTTIYYGHPTLNWSDAVQIAFLGHHEMFGTGNNWLTDLPANADAYTGFLHYSLQENSYNYFARNTNDAKGTAVSDSYLGTESTDWQKLNKTQTVQARVKATGSSYSDAAYASWPGSVSVARTYMSSATATSTPSAANMTSATTDAILTSSITLTASANSGYYFEGWGDASDANPTDGTAAKIYTITGTKTSYAFFSQAYTLTYDRKGDYNTSTVTVYSVNNFSGSTTSGSSIPTGHMITLVATPATGYEVEGWYSDASCATAYTSGSGGITIEGGGNTFKLASLNANTEVYCKFQPKTYTINLVGMEATTPGTTSVDVTYNASTNMTALDPIIKPTKTNYDFGGYWVRNEDTKALVTKLIDEDGKWIADVEGYTGNDGAGNPTWVHDYPISVYAKWTEKSHTVSVAVSAGGYSGTPGTVQINSSDVTEVIAGEVTWSPVMTPIANPGWKFKEWQKTSSVDFDLENYRREYQTSGTNSMAIKATADAQNITAVFEPRYYLVGGEYQKIDGVDHDDITTSGMPGWANYTVPFTVISTSPFEATCTRELTASGVTDKTYRFMIRDKNDGISYGQTGSPIAVLNDDVSLECDVANNQIQFYSNGGTTYTFRITDSDGDGYPTVTLERPKQVNYGWKYKDVDNELHEGNTGGSVTVKRGDDDITSGQWIPYNTSITHTAMPESGYSFDGWWSSNEFSGNYFSNVNPWPHNVTAPDNAYAKFSEKSTTVTINTNNTRGGSITVGEEAFSWGSTKTAGVTTKRTLVVTENTGYTFTGWALSSTPDFELQEKDSDTDKEVTLAGKGGTNGSSGTLTANFTAKTYNITLNDDQEGEHNGSATISYDATSLTVTSHAIIDGWMRLGYWNSAGNKVSDADGKLEANVPDYTNSSKEWNHDGDVTLWAHWYRIVTLDKNGGSGDGTIGVDYKGYSSSLSRPTRSGYSIEGFYAESGCTTKVMNPDGTLVKNVSGYTDSDGKWINQTVDKLYTKWIFIIYRTGDKDDDPRKQETDVESYAGGTISEAIEFRMKVRELDKWYTLCLPFTVNAVKVWDEGDCAYYDLVPYYRTKVGAELQGGHYIIRTPKTATNLAITEFGDWRDPTSPTDYVPSKYTPYIIQWHMPYFYGKYVSFFGAAGQDIPSSMSAGTAPTTSNVVNVCVNNSMTTGSVAGAYMLEPDYGSDGAWLRLEDASAPRTVLPFECYVLANTETTGRYLVIRRDMTITETPTGFDKIMPDKKQTNKVIVNGQLFIIRDNKMYNIYGKEVQQ